MFLEKTHRSGNSQGERADLYPDGRKITIFIPVSKFGTIKKKSSKRIQGIYCYSQMDEAVWQKETEQGWFQRVLMHSICLVYLHRYHFLLSGIRLMLFAEYPQSGKSDFPPPFVILRPLCRPGTGR